MAEAGTVGMTPPLLAGNCALYLDFDGTLAEFAPHPSQAAARTELPVLIQALHDRLAGAVAIITGRQLSSLDALLAPITLPAAGLHGAELRHAGEAMAAGVPPLSAVTGMVRALQARFAGEAGIVIEDKGSGVALHYRQAPHLADECQASLRALMPEQGLELLTGHMVVEARPHGVNKGQALAALAERSPFLGRVPVFVGDDVTDEDGFRMADRMGGYGVKVGEGASVARFRCTDVQAVYDWLGASVRQLERGEMNG